MELMMSSTCQSCLWLTGRGRQLGWAPASRDPDWEDKRWRKWMLWFIIFARPWQYFTLMEASGLGVPEFISDPWLMASASVKSLVVKVLMQRWRRLLKSIENIPTPCIFGMWTRTPWSDNTYHQIIRHLQRGILYPRRRMTILHAAYWGVTVSMYNRLYCADPRWTRHVHWVGDRVHQVETKLNFLPHWCHTHFCATV